jgi:hypothetical protein
MFRRKPYGQDPVENIKVSANNLCCSLGILFDTHIKYGWYGIIKFHTFKVLVFLRLKKPFGMVDVLEYHFDL